MGPLTAFRVETTSRDVVPTSTIRSGTFLGRWDNHPWMLPHLADEVDDLDHEV